MGFRRINRVFTGDGEGGMWRLEAGDRRGARITEVDTTESAHRYPPVLAGGRRVLFTVTGPSGKWEDARLEVLDLASGERNVLVEGGGYGRYVESGHIVFVQGTGTLLAVLYDLGRDEVSGNRVRIEEGVQLALWGAGSSFAVSETGTLAFVQHPSWQFHRLVWLDRAGRHLDTLGPPMAVGGGLEIAPDGSRLATSLFGPHQR